MSSLIPCLDLSQSPGLPDIYRLEQRGLAWRSADVDPNSCLVELGATDLDEIRDLAEQLRSNPAPILSLRPEQFDLPQLRRFMAQAKTRLDNAHGIAVIHALPLDDVDDEPATALFWIMGQLIGRSVAQKWDGTLLYHVRDTQQSYSYGIRGSYTNVELGFHVDNAFGVAPPDYVGLLCLRPSAQGGISRFCSVYSLHQAMFEAHPRLLTRLYRPLMWDRQAEHAKDAPKVALAPMFAHRGGRLDARINVSLVHKGYDLAGQAMDSETEEALAALQSVASDPGLWVEMPIERGQLQYLNNRNIVHYRSAFTDHDDGALKRHLIRTWHRDWGLASYDG